MESSGWMCVCWLLPRGPAPLLSPAPQASCSLRHSNPEARPSNSPVPSSKCSRERRSHIPLTSNQKLDTTKLSEERMSNSDTGWENHPLVPACECRGKALEEGNYKCYSSEHIKDKKAKQPQCWSEKVLVIWTEDQISQQHSRKPNPIQEQSPNSLQFY